MTIEEKQQQIIADFADFDDWFDKYSMLIELGNNLLPFDESKKTQRKSNSRMPKSCLVRC